LRLPIAPGVLVIFALASEIAEDCKSHSGARRARMKPLAAGVSRGNMTRNLAGNVIFLGQRNASNVYGIPEFFATRNCITRMTFVTAPG
jgi:hypothetical protein